MNIEQTIEQENRLHFKNNPFWFYVTERGGVDGELFDHLAEVTIIDKGKSMLYDPGGFVVEPLCGIMPVSDEGRLEIWKAKRAALKHAASN